jgi:hypothetical protein
VAALHATVLVCGVLAGLATWIYLSVGTILVWAAFLAWACFFHNGATPAAFKSTIICNTFGALLGWIAAVGIVFLPFGAALPFALWAGIVVMITVMVVCWASSIPALSSIPSSFYGYAASFAYMVQTPDVFTPGGLTSLTLSNPFILTAVSMAGGSIIGFISAKGIGALAAKPATA